ncbi:4Fe-4S binding protein [Thermofilum pendens]|uniref:Pyruvate ferredoxin/flavodoxin oxidoreductase, delta subunit n=1 Tax=Thermofilum pendens (strain DSM 2475 / Hrk 5) TaxID=368408 RepID=A1RXL7_THEPD|nr:4Fe-4S binding protein [Thermofilum pendens]ABL77947.1 pyruvate ferredoxin/flavodoxin oxidoreductase, delta subunit [Thermofilum pendens Hrk 5]
MSGTASKLLAKPVVGAVAAGSWRTERPVVDMSKCRLCGVCWLYCPDGVIEIDEDARLVKIDYDYCKGCGVCAAECPFKAISMVREHE